MISRSNHKELHDALERLEGCLEVPLVPGELERWVADVGAAVDAVGTVLKRQVEHIHPGEFEQITEEDPGLLARVRELKQADEESLERFDKIRHHIEQLAVRAPRIEPDEARIEDEVKAFVDQGLAFVIHIRTQEVAIRTWLQESLERDRGTVD